MDMASHVRAQVNAVMNEEADRIGAEDGQALIDVYGPIHDDLRSLMAAVARSGAVRVVKGERPLTGAQREALGWLADELEQARDALAEQVNR